MILYSQRDGRWSGKELGWGPPGSTIGLYGCIETDFAMIVNDFLAQNPATLDDALIAAKVFIRDPDGSGDYDLLPDNALDLLFSGAWQTTHVAGYDAAGIGPAVNSPDTYVILWISTASVPTHFVIAYSADGKYIADPWTGKVGTLAGYGGPGAVRKTTYVKHLAVQVPTPAPSPTPMPVPTPVPVPHFYVEDDADVVVAPPQSDLASAKALADSHAAANPGHPYVVEDDTEKEVYQALVPATPTPAPGPTPGGETSGAGPVGQDPGPSGPGPGPVTPPPQVPQLLPGTTWQDWLVNLADHEIVALIDYFKEHLANRTAK